MASNPAELRETTGAVQLSVEDAVVLHYAAWVFVQLGLYRGSRYVWNVAQAAGRLCKQLHALSDEGAEFPTRCVVCRRALPMVAPHVCSACYHRALERIADGDGGAVLEEMLAWPGSQGVS